MTALFLRAQTNSDTNMIHLQRLKYLILLFLLATSGTLFAADGGGPIFLGGALLAVLTLIATGLTATQLALSLVQKYPRG